MSTSSFVIPNDMSDLCRVCLQLPEESQYLDLTTIYDEDDNLTYGECFTICTQIDLNVGDGVPHHLCKSCGLELQMSYDFHKKIEESKRVIEQCRKQMNVQKSVDTELGINSEQCEIGDINDTESTLHIIDEKFVISNHELCAEEDSLLAQKPDFVAHTDVNNEPDDMESFTESNICQDQSHKNNSNMEVLNDNVNFLEMEDYQDLETLEEDETETIQLKCGENVIPVHITKFKKLERDLSDSFVEYVEEISEKNENVAEKEVRGEEYVEETNEEDLVYQLRWQENVVTVASKEHLPIEIETEEEEGEEFLEETHIIITESSQDGVTEDYDEEEKEDAKLRSNTNKNNSTTRKRHVGSYSCDYCQRVYPNYSRMKSHRRCHEVDRPRFTCPHCSRIYATKQARDCHVQTAHDKFGYNCSICSKVFAVRKNLEIHMRYHTGDFPYLCELCDRKFAQVCHLNTHINVKHNRIRFSCDYPNCGKYFTSSSSLRNHEYTHGNMPFECEYCQQGYPTKSKLRMHIQRKHCLVLTNDQLERMRKFHVKRSKANLVQFVET